MPELPPAPSATNEPDRQAEIVAELRQIRVNLEQLNKRAAGKRGGFEVAVFWKIAFGILMSYVILIILVILFWGVIIMALGSSAKIFP